MKLTPNSIKQAPGVRLKLEKTVDGLYVVSNAYEGHYEYFKGKPIPPRSNKVEHPSKKSS